MSSVSIITVNYNGGELIRNCVESIARVLGDQVEVIVVDNASSDGSIAGLESSSNLPKQLKIIRSSVNLGFAEGNNLGAQSASGNWLHFLNPDTEVGPGLAQLYALAGKGPERTIYVNPLLDPDGKVLRSRNMVPLLSNLLRSRILHRWELSWYLGASVLISRSAFEELGRWPSDYFMYAEDLDLFYHAHLKGMSVVESAVPVMHVSKGVTSRVWTHFERQVRVERAGLIFARKYRKSADYQTFRWISLIRTLVKDPKSGVREAKAFLAAKRELR